jgi:hypothetical protein
LGTLPTGGGSGGLTQAQVQTLIDASIAAIPAGVTDEAAVEAIIERKLTEFGPMIQEAVQSQFKAMPKTIRLNTDDGQVGIEGLDISGPNKPVSLNMDLPDGSLSVNGKRVLTVDDALDPSGVDTAAVEAALAPLQSQIDGLENQVRILTQYIDQEVGTVIKYVDLGLEKKADKDEVDRQDAEIVAWVTEKYAEKDYLEALEGAIIDQLSKALTDITANQKLVQDVMNAMNGPTATVQSITEMFWLLNDLLMALVDATGIDFPGGK